ncbi:MAG TPA: four helix bundle protein, partial [Rhodothermales bacterium]
GALVAEAWGRRRYHAAFRNRLSEALGEASETQSWLDQALASGYLDRDMYDRLDAEWNRVGAMLQGMLKQSAAFCGVPGKGSSGGKKGPSSNGRK